MKTDTRKRPALTQITNRLATEVDNEVELIDFSTLTGITPQEDADLSLLNYRVILKHPVKWEINESGGSHKIYADGSIEFNEKGSGEYHEIFPKCNTPTRPKVKHTQIISLLTQNNSGPTRPANFCYLWDQTDEAFYRGKAKEGLAEFIADTRPNYFCVPCVSTYRHLFKCPDLAKTMAAISAAREGPAEVEPDDDPGYDDDNVDYGYGHFELLPPDVHQGDILIHVDPKTGQATYVCPRCTYNNKKIFGGTGYPVKHPIGRDFRQKLAEVDIIPAKEYKYEKRTADRDANVVISVLKLSPHGIGSYQVDKACGWPEKTTQRLVEKYLNDVVVERTKKGKKKLYLIKNQYAE
jgi:hypothetical protein